LQLLSPVRARPRPPKQPLSSRFPPSEKIQMSISGQSEVSTQEFDRGTRNVCPDKWALPRPMGYRRSHALCGNQPQYRYAFYYSPRGPSLGSQGDYGVDVRRPSGGTVCGQQGDNRERRRSTDQCEYVGCGNAEQK